MRGYLGNQARGGGGGGGGGGGRSSKGRGRGGGGGNRMSQEGLPQDDFPEGETGIISPEELAASRRSMNLTELKNKPVHELVQMAETMGLENTARQRKQDVIFSILKAHARDGEDIYGDGVLEILQDGFGFLRSAEGSYLAGPDDIYVSPSQIRRFNLRTGDSISGLIRPPKDGERYFALLKVGEINFDSPESSRHKLLFENLTPLHPTKRLKLERGNGSTEDMTARVIDLTAPLGKGQRGLIVSPPKAGKTMLLQNIAHVHRRQSPRRLPHRAADRRAARGGDRDGAHGARPRWSPARSTSRPAATCRWPRWSSRRPSGWSSTSATS